MIKKFNRCYTTSSGNTHHNEVIEIDTNGNVGDWYPKLYSACQAFVIKNDYQSNDYITELIVYDINVDVYHVCIDKNHIISRGGYIKYVRNDQYPQGMWFGQYPENAWGCHGIFVPSIKDICDHLRKDPTFHTPVHDGLGDLLSAILYPDHIVNVDQDVNASIIPTKKQALKTIDDAILGYEILNQLNMTDYFGTVPEEYIEATQNIVKRLTDVRVWIDNSSVKTTKGLL